MGPILFNPKGHLVTPPPTTHMLRVREVLSQPLSHALTHSLTLFLFTFACILGCWLCSCYRMKALVWRRPLWLHLAIPSFLFGFMLEGSCPSWGHPAGLADWLEHHLLSLWSDLWKKDTIPSPVSYAEYWSHNIISLHFPLWCLVVHSWKESTIKTLFGLNFAQLPSKTLPCGHTLDTCLLSPSERFRDGNVLAKVNLSTISSSFVLWHMVEWG